MDLPKVFVDTSFWIAYFNSLESNHEKAKKWLKRLKYNPAILITSDFIVVETLNYFINCKKLNLFRRKEIAKKFYDSWFQRYSPLRELVRINNEIWDESARIYFLYKDKEFSFTDCTSFILMEKIGTRLAAHFDQHFNQASMINVIDHWQ